MAKFRKTVEIVALIDYANGYLSSDYPGADSPAAIARRTGVCDLLEAALMKAGRYNGYMYLTEKVITKSKPGIRIFEDDMFKNTDNTRRRYS